MRDYKETALFKHVFWMRILGDHARFIHDSLAPIGKKDIEMAQYFIRTFDYILRKLEENDLLKVSRQAD